MKRHGGIYEKIYDMSNLRLAHIMASKDKSHYHEVKKVNSNEEKYLKQIQKMLKEKTYHVDEMDYRRSTITDKWKERELRKLSYYPHRIIQRAILLQIESIFMETFCYHTCASLKDRWIKRAHTLTNKYVNMKDSLYCLKIDIHKFYPSVNHQILKELLRRKFKDKDLLRLLDSIIDSYPWEKWIPIGSYLSQYFWNYYLSYFDHRMKEQLWLEYVVRYMDDIVIFSDSKEHLHLVLVEIQTYLKSLELELKPNYQIFPLDRWVDFVWFRFFKRYILLRRSTCRNMKKKLKKIKKKSERHKELTYWERCSANSYMWWMLLCDHHRLYMKYACPVVRILIEYYRQSINESIYKTRQYGRWLRRKRF